MVSKHFITARAFLVSFALMSAHVPASLHSPRRALPPGDISQTTQEHSLQIHVTNATHSLPSLLTNNIQCFNPWPGRPPATIEGCRATLNKIKTFPLYRLKQDFQENIYPRKPSPPPLAIYDYQCIVEIAGPGPGVVDQFSFEQVRVLALEIIEYCLDHGGIGGISPIGRGIGWTVAAKGVRITPSAGGGNETATTHDEEGLANVAAVSA